MIQYVLLNSFKKVRDFVEIISPYEGNIDLFRGECAVNAKSILAIFSMDLTKPLGLKIHENDKAAEDILSKLNCYLVSDGKQKQCDIRQ